MRSLASALFLAFAAVATAAEPDRDEVLSAIVSLKATVAANARSAATLGRERTGTGVLIRDGVVLTIGYLVIEAESIELTGADGRSVPAAVAAYDHASGFGLLQALAPLAGKPLALGDSAALAERERAMVITSASREAPTLVTVLSRRPFAGSWEYQIESGIFTFPPVPEWSGAALIGGKGELLGIGSLILADAGAPGTQSPGNLFVPVDLLRPVLDGLLANGRRPGPQRPWLGLNTDEVRGHLFVGRVSPESPAEHAGIKAGDIILAVGQDEVTTLAEFYRRLWARGAAGTDIPLWVLQGARVREVRVHSIDRAAYFRASKSH